VSILCMESFFGIFISAEARVCIAAIADADMNTEIDACSCCVRSYVIFSCQLPPCRQSSLYSDHPAVLSE
jgi:hypothetical protein